jgi:hypothetical protein
LTYLEWQITNTPKNKRVKNTFSSYISVTLSFTQTIPAVSAQQAVEEIDEIPEFSISQSVAARAIVRSEHIIIILGIRYCALGENEYGRENP